MAPIGKKSEGVIKKEDVITALLIADDFESRFGLLEEDTPKILLPLVNVPILDYTLEFLHASGVQRVIIFCCNNAAKLKNYIRDSPWINNLKNMTITVTISETCLSVGDALRDVYDKRLITDDFVLLTNGVVSNIQLKPLIELHRETKKKDKSTVITTLLSRHSFSNGNANSNSTVVAYLEDTRRILFLQNVFTNPKVSIPLDVLLDNPSVNVFYDLLDCNINICSAEVLSLFADNFDYQTRNDFIKGLLVHEEVLGNTAYINIIEDGYAAPITDLQSYREVSHDIINHWVVPITPEHMLMSKGEVYNQLRHNIYKHHQVALKNCYLIRDVVVGKGSKMGTNCVVSNSVIGDNCEIGNDVHLKDAFIWDNARIGSNCKIEAAIIDSRTMIGNEVEIYNSVIGKEVALESKLKIHNCFKFNVETDDLDEDESNDEEVDPWHLNLKAVTISSSDDDLEDAEDNVDGEFGGSPELDDTKLFYRELRDTLIRGLEEKLTCDNLILEINSLKYAYNVTITEVNHLLTKAVLDISEIALNPKEKLAHLKQLLKQFQGIFVNYLKSQTSQTDVLNSLKEYAIENSSFLTTIANIVHYFYETEVLLEEVIITWYNNLEDDEWESKIKSKISPLIKWLEEAEEESD